MLSPNPKHPAAESGRQKLDRWGQMNPRLRRRGGSVKQGGGENWNVSAQCLILESFIDLLVKMEVQQKLVCLLRIPGLGTFVDFVRSV